MRPVLQFLFGIRSDLDLCERWWHRLFKVAFVLAIGVIGALAWWINDLELTPPRADTAVILANLREFTEHTLSIDNTIPAFLGLPGQTGVRDSRGAIRRISGSELEAGNCSKANIKLAVAMPEPQIAGFESKPLDAPTSIDRAQLWIPGPAPGLRVETRSIPNERGGDPLRAYCLIPPNVAADSADSIVKWRYSISAKVARVETTGAIVGLLVLLTLNMYYRGLIYIVFGSRKRTV